MVIYFYKKGDSIVTVSVESYVLFKMFIFSFIIEKITMLCFVLSLYGKNRFISLSIFILFVLFCIPGTCVFYNSSKKKFFLHLWSNNQFSCGILRKIFTIQVGDYEQIIKYDWPHKAEVAYMLKQTSFKQTGFHVFTSS